MRRRFCIAILMAVVAIVSISIFAIGIRRHVAAQAQDPASARSNNSSSQSQLPPEAPRDVVLITLLPTGFEPSEVTHRAEPFLLVVQNRSGKNNPVFAYDWNFGKKAKPKRIPQKKDSQAEVVNLQPGTYEITVRNQPDSSCKIIITPEN